MPYHVGEKGSNGCSGYPVVSDKGHIAGCHPTEAAATNQMQALYANVEDASKADGCTPDSPDCGDEMCKACIKKFWNGSAFEGKL